MESAEYTIAAMNGVLAFGLGWPLAGHLAGEVDGLRGRRRTMILLVAVYLIESFAFAASMSTSILSILLAGLWGILLGRRLRRSRSDPGISRRIALLFSGYTALPAASFLSVPAMMALKGWSVVTSAEGIRFGVPRFLPWPLDTILGFCTAVALVTVVFKVVITSGLVRLTTDRKERTA